MASSSQEVLPGAMCSSCHLAFEIMVLAVSWTKELSTIAFDNGTASELQRPTATFEAHGLAFNTAPILNHRIDNQAELHACLQNVVRVARHLRQQAEKRQVNMSRLYAEFITAFLTQRQQLEMIFVHTRVALRKGRVPDAAWTQAMQAITWKTRSSEASQDDLHTLVNRAAFSFEFRKDAPPIFVPSKFGLYVDRIYNFVLLVLWHPLISSDWARAACRNHETPNYHCIQLYQRWLVDYIHFSDAFIRFG
ncbi:hypothetical protein F5Y03DRAFT_389055 [Xylaria venustula]|nr:hypothetical protein F5Y03DRAFT_389055 [Xylaria venustula]